MAERTTVKKPAKKSEEEEGGRRATESSRREDSQSPPKLKARRLKGKAMARCVGLDLGDRKSAVCVLNMTSGEVEERSVVSTTAPALQERFADEPRMRIVIEAGTHSPWVSRLLERLGHEVVVANPSKMAVEGGGRRRRKTDRIDAEQLARLGRVDVKMLHPLQHRSIQTQADLSLLRSRQATVRSRAKLINHVRGQVKSMGGRLSKTSTESFVSKTQGDVPAELREGLEAIYATIGDLTKRIRDYDKKIDKMAHERYPHVSLLTPIVGVGTLTALAYVLTLDLATRFRKSRSVGPYLGLTPGTRQSGDSDPELGITKEGSVFMRSLLCESAQYMLGPFGKDCDLRRHGERIAGIGGKNAKKRAVVAVARKLAVLMHRLWSRGEVYDPLYNAKRAEARTVTAKVA